MADQSDLARVLARAEYLATGKPFPPSHLCGGAGSIETLRDAARILRSLAADFEKYAVHGCHTDPRHPDRGCPKDNQPNIGVCECNLDSARARWRLDEEGKRHA